MNKNTIGGIFFFLLGLFAPFYIGCELLPDGWVGNQEPGFWWTIPAVVCLIFGGIMSIIFGLATFFED
jgi:hypothetical protein